MLILFFTVGVTLIGFAAGGFNAAIGALGIALILVTLIKIINEDLY